LNPKWKGKISTEDPTGRGAGNAGAGRFYRELGEEFVKKLYIDMKSVFSRDRRQLVDWLARGTYPICIQCRHEDVDPLRQEGYRMLEIFELSDVPAMMTASPWLLTVANRAPHPHAAQLFANWIISREALQVYSRGHGVPTLRNDLDESFLRQETIPKPRANYFDNADWNWVTGGKDEVGEKVRKLLKAQ
jgi:ABC-type Fe3+ transport system substrate-binding protein